MTEPGGKIVDLSGGDLEVVEEGPRDGSPIVLIHCFTCAINYWNEMMPALARQHRVIAIDLLGHGGSEKPKSGYSVSNQAESDRRRHSPSWACSDAEVVGHSLGGAVAVALAQQSPALVNRVFIVDTPPTHEEGDLGLVAKLGFAPVIGEAFWRIKPDFAVRKGLEVAFAPGFDVPDEFVEDVDRMTFSAYDDSASGFDDYTKEEPLDQRMAETGKPLMVIMGAEEQIIDEPAKRLAEYRATVPGTETKLIAAPDTRQTSRNRPRPRPSSSASLRPQNQPPSQITVLNCKSPCRNNLLSGSTPRVEPMFDTKTNLTVSASPAQSTS